jgi:chromosome segregation protein
VTDGASARLLGLRIQGFKSFADRTVVEFGSGISAVVGPNGSGKSNLADALRWTLGEQGRSLRTRKSEDVIFAGSESRAALGMADVTLVLDNSDALLPVDYSVLELGRRLYRSGESDYLLNRQRVRLKDLIDLLDAAHLADNAFLFIGQGMVDQALALRPEERRPLFEEVAGVRRHDRRRRKAEEQLAEAEANLARVEDILGELRPQAKRLAAQAEQQATRQSAGEELAAALILAAHVRWHETASRMAAAGERLTAARSNADAALNELAGAERAVGTLAEELDARVSLERERREIHERIRDELGTLQLREARIAADVASLDRERRQAEEEREAAARSLTGSRRALAMLTPERDVELESALSSADRSLSEAMAELGAMRATKSEQGEREAAVLRVQAERAAEIEGLRRRAGEAERRATEQRSATASSRTSARELTDALGRADTALEMARAAEADAALARERVARSVADAESTGRHVEERLAGVRAAIAATAGGLQALRARIAEEEARGIARAARRQGGERLDDGLDVDPILRPAVEAVLGETARGYLVGREAVAGLAGERGVVALHPPDRRSGSAAKEAAGDAVVLERASQLGGGPLSSAIRRDPTGAVGRLLRTAVWLPDLPSAMEIQSLLPVGWLAATRDGSSVVGPITIALGRPDGLLDRRAEEGRLALELGQLEEEAAKQEAAATAGRVALEDVRRELATAQGRVSTTASDRARAEAALRAASRDADTAAGELAWHEAQADRLEREARRLAEELAALETSDSGFPHQEAGRDPSSARAGPTAPGTAGDEALSTWEARVEQLRARRDRLGMQAEEHDRRRREAEAAVAQARATADLDERRIAGAEVRLLAIAERGQRQADDHSQVQEGIAGLKAREAQARANLEALLSADAADRSKLADAERAAAAAREKLRRAEDGLRRAEVDDLEARLGHDAIREQVLVELAGLGELGLRALRAGVPESAQAGPPSVMGEWAAASPPMPRDSGDVGESEDASGEAAALEAALALVAPTWESEPPTDDAPTPGRLASLRRRYHELGAANPFAVDEYEQLKARLDSLESQREDLSTAIGRTRTLIADLSTLIADRFQATFRALETAFDARFRQLFGGGFARLALTEPDDLSSTGVEIVARPPGKKTQALAMLSGGERALTAVALLFAMLEVRPVPFCVLDEVDAALDEANIGRFTDALRSLAVATQFIVITHNRGTIEVADALYGVTVGDDSVSRVISLRLDEATALARQDREASSTNGHAPTPVASA